MFLLLLSISGVKKKRRSRGILSSSKRKKLFLYGKKLAFNTRSSMNILVFSLDDDNADDEINTRMIHNYVYSHCVTF